MGGSESKEEFSSDSEEEDQAPKPKAAPEAGNYEYDPFTDFPEPGLLRDSQVEWNQCRRLVNHIAVVDGVPVPHPPRNFKEDFWNPERLADVDRNAVHTPPKLRQEPFEALVAHLLRPAKNDLQRARAIFRWIAEQNLTKIPDYSSANPGSPFEYLKDVKNFKRPYSELVQRMYDCAKIPCVTIKGRVKAARYERGDPTTVNYDATWNAVLIDKDWRLMNVNWACRALAPDDGDDDGPEESEDEEEETRSSSRATKAPKKKKKAPRYGRKVIEQISKNTSEKQKKIVEELTMYALEEEYFLTDPHIFIYQHFPDDPAWQLLGRPVMEEEFYQMVYLTPFFFILGLDVLNREKVNIDTVCGASELYLKLPGGGEKRKFDYRLTSIDKGMAVDLPGIRLSRYCFMDQIPTLTQNVYVGAAVKTETTRAFGTLEIYGRYPKEGTYLLSIFGKDPNIDASFKELAGYIIHCHSEKKDCKSFPPRDKRLWGPIPDAEEVGLLADTHESGTVETNTGEAEIVFTMKHPDARFDVLTHLESVKHTRTSLQKFKIHRREDGKLKFNVRVPEPGEYSFQVYIQQRGKKTKNAAMFLIYSTARPQFPFPYAFDEDVEVGLSSDAKDVGLTPINHSGQYFNVDKGNFDFEFESTVPIDCETKMSWQSLEDGSEDLSQYSQVEFISDKKVTFHCKFPNPGSYLFTVNGRERGLPSVFLPLVSYVITVTQPDPETMPFPKVSKAFGEGFTLQEGKEGLLKPNSTQKIVITAPPGTTEISCNGVKFEKVGENTWQAVVSTGDGGKDLEVKAKEGDLERSLMTYRVLSPKEAAVRQEKVAKTKAWVADMKQSYEKEKKELDEKKNKEQELSDKHTASDKEKAKTAEVDRERRRVEAQHKREELLTAVLKEGEDNLSVKELHDQLKKAIEEKDHDKLIRLVRQYKDLYGGDARTSILTEAEDAVKMIEIKKGIVMAAKEKRYNELKAAIQSAKHYGLEEQLKEVLQDANKKLKTMEKFRAIGSRLLDMNKTILLELKRYTKPPKLVHEVIRATLLLLNEHEGKTQEWKHCVKFVTLQGNNSMKALIMEFDHTAIHPEIWSRCRELLIQYDLEEVAQASLVAAAMYQWSYGVVQEREEDFMDEYPPAADIDRQIELLEVFEDDYCKPDRKASKVSNKSTGKWK